MTRIVKAAAAVLVVVVLGGCPGGRCGAAHFAINCMSDVKIPGSGNEELIHREAIRHVRPSVNENMFMVPLPGFAGVRAKLTTNKGTFTAWFPIMDHCGISDSWWWRMFLKVEKHASSTLLATLAVHNCLLSCELTTGVSDLQLQNLTLYGRGASNWRTEYPPKPCHVEEIATDLRKVTLHSCTNPPPISSASPPRQTPSQITPNITTPAPTTDLSTSKPSPHQNESLVLWGASVAVVVVVVTVTVVVVVLLKMRRRFRRENEQSSQLTHSIQDVQDTRNSLYESFDQYQQHFSGPGQGDAPPDTHR